MSTIAIETPTPQNSKQAKTMMERYKSDAAYK